MDPDQHPAQVLPDRRPCFLGPASRRIIPADHRHDFLLHHPERRCEYVDDLVALHQFALLHLATMQVVLDPVDLGEVRKRHTLGKIMLTDAAGQPSLAGLDLLARLDLLPAALDHVIENRADRKFPGGALCPALQDRKVRIQIDLDLEVAPCDPDDAGDAFGVEHVAILSVLAPCEEQFQAL